MNRARLAWIQIRSQRAEVGSAIVVIALGIGLATSILLANSALETAFDDSLAALAGRADLHIRARGGGSLDERFVAVASSVSGVSAAAPILLANGFLEGPDPIRVRIVGVDMLDDATVRLYDASPTDGSNVEDPLVFLSQPDSAIFPTALLARLPGAGMGTSVSIQTPTGRGKIVVRGVLNDAGVARAFAGNLLVMDLEAAQNLMSLSGRLSQIDVVAAENEDPAAVAKSLSDALPPFLEITSAQALRERLRRTIDAFRLVITSISMMGLVLACIITSNRLSTVYQERMWEMAVLRGMGWTPGALMLDLLAEAALMSAIASALGLPIGVVLAEVMLSPIRDATALSLQQALAAPTLEIDGMALVTAAGAGLAASLAAAFFPALRAARAPIVVLGARRRRRDPRPEKSTTRALRIAMPLVALSAFALHLATGSRSAALWTVVSSILGASLLVQPALRIVASLVGRFSGEAAAVGVRDQSRAPSRAVGATSVLLAGIALVVWIESTSRSFESYAVDTNVVLRGADLIVDSAFDDQPTASLQPRFTEEIVERLSEIDGVEAVGADAETVVTRPGVGLMAVDGRRLVDPRLGPWSERNSAEALELVAAGDGALADPTLLENMGLKIGDEIEIASPSGPVSFSIVGTTPTAFISAQGDLVIGRNRYKERWSDSTVNRIYVAVAAGVPRQAVRQAILDRLGDRFGLRVRTITEFSSWISENVRSGFAFLGFLTAVTFFVVVVGTADALAANVAERTREIGTLRSLGYPPASIAAMVIGQALAIGVAGCALAVVLGLVLSVVFVEGVLEPAVGWDLIPKPSYSTGAWATCLGIAACLLGAAFPAFRASRMPIARALRYE